MLNLANHANSDGSLRFSHTFYVSTELVATRDHDAHSQTNQTTTRAKHPEHTSAHWLPSSKEVGSITGRSGIWSAAYREAINSLGEDLDVAILMGNNATQLFKELEAIDNDASQHSAFLRGVAYFTLHTSATRESQASIGPSVSAEQT